MNQSDCAAYVRANRGDGCTIGTRASIDAPGALHDRSRLRPSPSQLASAGPHATGSSTDCVAIAWNIAAAQPFTATDSVAVNPSATLPVIVASSSDAPSPKMPSVASEICERFVTLCA